MIRCRRNLAAIQRTGMIESAPARAEAAGSPVTGKRLRCLHRDRGS